MTAKRPSLTHMTTRHGQKPAPAHTDTPHRRALQAHRDVKHLTDEQVAMLWNSLTPQDQQAYLAALNPPEKPDGSASAGGAAASGD